jgi:quinohemoprotein ethanol dehydrogenase
VLPDLRKSASIADADTWKSVVIDGVLKGNGMVSFASVLSPQEAEQMRAYVISRAHYSKANDKTLASK